MVSRMRLSFTANSVVHRFLSAPPSALRDSSLPEIQQFIPELIRNVNKTHGIVLEESALHKLANRVKSPEFLLGKPRYQAICKARFGKCISFGIPFTRIHFMNYQSVQEEQNDIAWHWNTEHLIGRLGRYLGKGWQSLVAHEGFLLPVDNRIQWGDLDSMGHANNVNHFKWCENSRIQFVRRLALNSRDRKHNEEWNQLWTPTGTGLILRNVKMEYKFPLTFPDKVFTVHRLRSLPKPTDTSFVLDSSILSSRHQRVAARAVEEIVLYDYTTRRKVPIPPYMMEAFERTWIEQKEHKTQVSNRAFYIESILMILEKLTWDREGAVEDLGSQNSAA